MSERQTQSNETVGEFEPVADEASWHALSASLPPHALQSWTWGAFKSDWEWTMEPMVLRRGNRPGATAMLLKRKAPRLPFSILYLPKGPTFDYADATLRDEVLTKLENLARRQRAIFIKIDPEIILSTGVDEEAPNEIGVAWRQALQARGWRFSDSQIQFPNTVTLDLTVDADELLARMKQKTRYNIRLAARKEVTVRVGTPSDFPLVAEMYTETATRDNFTIRPTAYYLDAWQRFDAANMLHLLIAEVEGTPVSAIILIKSHNRVTYMYGASTHLERKRMPNYLLQWEAIQWAQAQGCQIYDFWGAPTQFDESDALWGVWRFKAGFNGTLVRHIGAWDYPARPFLYWVYTTVIPRYLSLLRRRNQSA